MTKSTTKISSKAAHNSCHPAAEQAAAARLSNYAIQWDVRANICSMGKVQPYLNTVFLLPSTRWPQEDRAGRNTGSQHGPPGSGGRQGRLPRSDTSSSLGMPAPSILLPSLFITTCKPNLPTSTHNKVGAGLETANMEQEVSPLQDRASSVPVMTLRHRGAELKPRRQFRAGP